MKISPCDSYHIYGSDLKAASRWLKFDVSAAIEQIPSPDIVLYDWGAGDGSLLRDALRRSSKQIYPSGCTLESHNGLPDEVFVGDVVIHPEKAPQQIHLLISNFGILHLFLQALAAEYARGVTSPALPSRVFAEHLTLMLSRIELMGAAAFNLFNPETLNSLYNDGRSPIHESSYSVLISDMIAAPVSRLGYSALAIFAPHEQPRDWPSFIIAPETATFEHLIAPKARVFEIVRRGERRDGELSAFIAALLADTAVRPNEAFNIWKFLHESLRVDPDDYY